MPLTKWRKHSRIIAVATLAAYVITGVIGGPAARYLCIEPQGRVTIEPFWFECCPSLRAPTCDFEEDDCGRTVAEEMTSAEAETSGCEGCVDVPIPVEPHQSSVSDDRPQSPTGVSVHFAPLAFLLRHHFDTDGGSRPVFGSPPTFALSLRAAILRC